MQRPKLQVKMDDSKSRQLLLLGRGSRSDRLMRVPGSNHSDRLIKIGGSVANATKDVAIARDDVCNRFSSRSGRQLEGRSRMPCRSNSGLCCKWSWVGYNAM